MNLPLKAGDAPPEWGHFLTVFSSRQAIDTAKTLLGPYAFGRAKR